MYINLKIVKVEANLILVLTLQIMEMLKELKKLRNLIQAPKEIRQERGFGRRITRMIRCFACQKEGHLARECPEISKKSLNYIFKKQKIEIPVVEDLVNQFPKLFKENNQKIEFTEVEKCRIDTEPGKAAWGYSQQPQD